jgi:hypothetical protein
MQLAMQPGQRLGVSVYVGCWRSLAIGRLHSSWTLERGDDLVGVLGSGERLAALVPAIAEPADRRDQPPTLATSPRRSAWRSMIEKNTSTRCSHKA